MSTFPQHIIYSALAPISATEPDLADVLALGAEVGLTLANHGVSVVQVV